MFFLKFDPCFTTRFPLTNDYIDLSSGTYLNNCFNMFFCFFDPEIVDTMFGKSYSRSIFKVMGFM